MTATLILPPDMEISPTTADVPDLPIYRLSVEQYHHMLATGILEEGLPVELLGGWLVRKMTKNPPHEAAIRRLRRCLEARVKPLWDVDVQSPIELSDSEPEPDISVVRPSEDDYAERHPQAADVGLVVEVAPATLKTNRGFKLRIYAAASLPQYWIVNLEAEQIEVYREPAMINGKPGYVQRTDFGVGQSVPVTLAGQSFGDIPVSDVLP